MKLNHIYKSIACGVLLAMTATSCDLDYNPVDTYSDVTEGVNKTDEKPIFNSVQDVETSMVTLHKKFRDRQEHWYVDKLLIGDAHSDNAYAGTTGAEVVPYETNSIEGSNSVLKRDWDRFLGDIAVANRIIVGCDQLKALSESERGKYQSQAKIFRAMVMFDMVRLWGNFPVITTVGGDITEDNVEEMYPTYFPPQNTAEEAYAQIEKDLTEAVDIDNTNYSKIVRNSHYYLIGHMSSVVKPGAVRIGTTGYTANGITYSAFENTDGTYAFVLANNNADAKRITVSDGTHYFSYEVPAKAVVSYRWKK